MKLFRLENQITDCLNSFSIINFPEQAPPHGFLIFGGFLPLILLTDFINPKDFNFLISKGLSISNILIFLFKNRLLKDYHLIFYNLFNICFFLLVILFLISLFQHINYYNFKR